MLSFSHAAEPDGWHHLVSGDKSWFFFNTSRGRIWTLPKDNMAQNRDLIFRANNSQLKSVEIRAAVMLSTNSQMIRK
jgi:hypothetical protein